MINSTPETSSTIESFVSFRNSDKNIYYSNLSVFEKSIDGTKLLLTYNVLNDYYDELMEAAATVELTDAEFNLYQYNPKRLSNYLYDSTEYYYIILFINQMASVKEFNKKKIKLIRPKALSNILSAIYSSEQSFLTTNQNLLKE